jgi:NRPS condensation-like uncharacterized protein
LKYKAEIFDYLQFLYNTTGFNDHQLHCVIKFENKVNIRIMEKAVTVLTRTVPVLTRVYRHNNGRSYWEDTNEFELSELFKVVDDIEEFEAFTYSKTYEEAGPQIKVCLLQAESDSLSIVMNHMVTDGIGIKQCTYLLSDIYSNLIKNPEFKPENIIDGQRDFRKVLSHIPLWDKFKILFLNNKDNNQSIDYTFPMNAEEKTAPFILTHELIPDRYSSILNYCKKHTVTVNDVMLTAYFRVLSKMLGINGKPLNIPIMIDMRRYLRDKDFSTLTNLASTVIISTTVDAQENFSETLAKVCAEMKIKKNNYLGINPYIKLDTLFRICKGNLAFKILKRSLKNPNICMTNIGVLDSAKLHFEGSPVSNAFVCGSIKYRPHFQMAISSFNGRMTLSVNLYGSLQDRNNISEFFKSIDKELMCI